MDKLGPFELGRVHCGDCLELMRQLPDGCIDAVVTDPPYGLEFMGKEWDKLGGAIVENPAEVGGFQDGAGGNPFSRSRVRYGSSAASMQEWHRRWAVEALRVAKPGAHLLAFGGTRTWHRLACAIEDAGWEIRDCIMWLYGSGFPKSLDVSKAIDKAAGLVRPRIPGGQGGRNEILGERKPGEAISGEAISGEAISGEAKQWQGWGTALKPGWEPIIVARKPLAGTVAANVLTYGTGALNIDGCRIDENDKKTPAERAYSKGQFGGTEGRGVDGMIRTAVVAKPGRFPANLIHDGSEEVTAGFPQTGPASGSAARFFYSAKADANDRGPGNDHPTVKPLDLMRYLCRLVTPPNGIILDPFSGSGRTGVAALQQGFRFFGCELDPHYAGDVCAPALEAASKGLTPAEHKMGQEVLFAD